MEEYRLVDCFGTKVLNLSLFEFYELQFILHYISKLFEEQTKDSKFRDKLDTIATDPSKFVQFKDDIHVNDDCCFVLFLCIFN